MRAFTRLRALVPALGLACGSAAPEDPLDPDAVDEVAKGEGDAEGDARSGAYRLTAEGPRTCDCPEIEGFDLCAADLTALGDQAVVELTQADGYLLLAPRSAPDLLSLAGSLDRDGAFDLGGIYDLASVLGDGDLYTRMTGEFTGADRFAAVLRSRISGTIQGQSVDCRTEVDLTGERITN
ncbi:MAG: hypothetical protein JNL82_05960 [Myxococcales bacterium]|nr:hypothetical protein [Myxococcales bacterium]